MPPTKPDYTKIAILIGHEDNSIDDGGAVPSLVLESLMENPQALQSLGLIKRADWNNRWENRYGERKKLLDLRNGWLGTTGIFIRNKGTTVLIEEVTDEERLEFLASKPLSFVNSLVNLLVQTIKINQKIITGEIDNTKRED